MNILPTAQVRQLRCPRCGNSVLPQHTPGMKIVCPIVGCNGIFDPDNMPSFYPDPPRMNLVTGAVAGQADGSASPLNFGRNESGEIIVTGVNGSPSVIDIPTSVNGRAVMGIGPRAFADQTALRRVTLPDTVVTIGEDAFAGCVSLESVTFGTGLRILDMGCFRDCASLDYVSLPARVEEIGRDAFAQCTSLAEVELNGPVKVIRDNAFGLCEQLSIFKYPERPQRIAPGAFSACYMLPQSVQDDLFPNGQ